MWIPSSRFVYFLPSNLQQNLYKRRKLLSCHKPFSLLQLLNCAHKILKVAELVAQPFKDIKVSAGRTPAHLIVRTSQGLITSIQKKEIDLSQTDLIVLDEADDQLKGDAALRILQIISKLPKGAGLFFFSTTFTKESIDYMNQFFTKVSLKFVLRYMLKTKCKLKLWQSPKVNNSFIFILYLLYSLKTIMCNYGVLK